MSEKLILEKLFNLESFLGCLSSDSQATIILAIRDMMVMCRTRIGFNEYLQNINPTFILFMKALREYDINADITADILIEICFNVFDN